MKTVKGIYLDLNDSTYTSKFRDYKFYFSSKFYKQKFEREYEDYIKFEKARLRQKYHIYIDMSDVLILTLYINIEKRGCRVEYENILLDLGNVKYVTKLFER